MSGSAEVSALRALAPEGRVRLRVNDAVTLEWACTPRDLRTLVAGWLLCEGVIHSAEEIEHLAESDPDDGCSASLALRLAQPAFERLSTAVSGDSVSSVRPAALAIPMDVGSPDAGMGDLRSLLTDQGRVAAWFRDMFERAALRTSIGGVHTGGLVMGGELVDVVEDVSRHHVVDRMAGAALMAGATRRSLVFLVSARISGAMAAKACRAGVGALVSRSVPTELAATVAAGNGLILVGRARRESPHYYWPEPGGTG